MELEERAKILRANLDEKKKSEDSELKKSRMKDALKDRDEAMKTIYDYQDKTGIPTQEETEKNFFDLEAQKN